MLLLLPLLPVTVTVTVTVSACYPYRPYPYEGSTISKIAFATYWFDTLNPAPIQGKLGPFTSQHDLDGLLNTREKARLDVCYCEASAPWSGYKLQVTS